MQHLGDRLVALRGVAAYIVPIVNPLAWARAEILHTAWKRGMYLPPDRKVLEREILDELARDERIERVLFVGVQWYTSHYASKLAGKSFMTIDPSSAVAKYGAEKHAIGQIQDLPEHFPGVMFDAIVMSGVIGFGLNDPAEVERAMKRCADGLRGGGWLVLGVNEEKPTHVPPERTKAAAEFAPAPFGRSGRERIDVALPFRERRHTFLFWQKRAGIA